MTTAIDVRRMWREVAVEGLRHPTRSLYEDHVDTMFNDEVGKLYCKSPKSGKARWRMPRCKTAHRTNPDQRGQASHYCGVAAAHLSMEASAQETLYTGTHPCQARSRLSVGAALYART